MSDDANMRRALELAAPGVGRTGDNPSVGCVIVRDGALMGEGARGGDVFVTLEPCAKRSTGAMSCADRLIEAGVARVVIAVRDPHPFASGVGLERLRAAGVRVEIGLLEAEARAQNAAFFASVEKD
jgi:diaminohydroxyphosphoribosylaminopyrimidine deaminase/5-amino-6-(5-phosphoribosylamino)uracil reductase